MKTRGARPLLSVVIPTWNRERLVCEAVESALRQGETVAGEIEVIVVDDGSTDHTLAVLSHRFGSRIRLLALPQRRGAGAARNAGVREARGELLAFLDSDDLWLPGKLEAELRVLDRHPEAEVIVSDSLTFEEAQPSNLTWFAIKGLMAATQGEVRWLRECPWLWTSWHNTLAMCSITMRRTTLGSLGQPLFAENLNSCEDWDLELRLYNECRVIVLPQVWAHVRRFDDDTRLGRPMPGRPRTAIEEIAILRDRLHVLERSVRLKGMPDHLYDELERGRLITAEQLTTFERSAG